MVISEYFSLLPLVVKMMNTREMITNTLISYMFNLVKQSYTKGGN